MDPMFLAMSLYRRRKFEQCVEICTDILSKNPYDQVSAFSSHSRILFTIFAKMCLTLILSYLFGCAYMIETHRAVSLTPCWEILTPNLIVLLFTGYLPRSFLMYILFCSFLQPIGLVDYGSLKKSICCQWRI